MSTFLGIKNQVVYNLGGRNDDNTLEQIKFQANFVQRILAATYEWEDLQAIASPSFVVDQYEYTEAELSLTTPQRIYAVAMNDGTNWQLPMTEVSKWIWNRDYAPSLAAESRQPTVFSRFGGKFYFFRPPDDTYELRIEYLKKPTAITGDNTVLSFEDKDELIVALTTGMMWLATGEIELSDKWLKLATPMIDSFNLDSSRILNYISPGNRARKSSSSTPWADPFDRGRR